MKKLTMVFALFMALFLAGCATDNGFVDAQARASIAHSESQRGVAADRMKAIELIATSAASDASKAMGFMSLMAQGQPSATQPHLQAPQASQALQWASVLVPGLTQSVGIVANMRMGIAQSNNAARVAESTNSTFLGVASKIQAPAASVTTTNTTTSTATNTTTTDSHAQTLSGTGNLGAGTYSTTDSRSTQTPLVITPVIQIVPITQSPVTTTTEPTTQ